MKFIYYLNIFSRSSAKRLAVRCNTPNSCSRSFRIWTPAKNTGTTKSSSPNPRTHTFDHVLSHCYFWKEMETFRVSKIESNAVSISESSYIQSFWKAFLLHFGWKKDERLKSTSPFQIWNMIIDSVLTENLFTQKCENKTNLK